MSMSNIFRPIDFDIIYLSYDEPNAEKNYADLLNKVPWAKRVHGVKGSDSAHKACAKLSDTWRFVTVDGDNTLRPEFLNLEIPIDQIPNYDKVQLSWCGYNIINGLIYGNGGVKCWTKEHVLNMKTHENSNSKDETNQVDFCWDGNYLQLNACFSDVHNNATPFQAWRAGFREGVKMVLNRGEMKDKKDFRRTIHWKNYKRLLTWMTIGADVENGLWAIYGARLGCHMTVLSSWDYRNVRDFDYLEKFYKENVEGLSPEILNNKIMELGDELRATLDIPLESVFTKTQSEFFKEVFDNPVRNHNMTLFEK